MRYVAIDLGDKRTGVATGDAITGLCLPAGVIEVPMSHDDGRALLDAIAGAVRDHLGTIAAPGWGRAGPGGEIVLGLPLNMDGSEGPRAKLIRQWQVRIAQATGRVVHVQDERLTSAAADWEMAQSGRTHGQKKQARDALAAATILRDFIAARQRGEPISGDAAGNEPARDARPT